MSIWKRIGLIVAAFALPLFLGSVAAQDAKGYKGDAARGKKVFDENGCERCHNIDSTVVELTEGWNEV